MKNSRIPSKNPVWRAIAVAGLAMGLVTVLPFMAGSASAHHSTMSANVDCEGLVSWTTVSWAPQYYSDHRGENSDIHVYLEIEDQAKVLIAEGAFTPENNYRFSGTFAWPLDDTSHLADYVYVSSKPNALWGNRNNSTDGERVRVWAPSGCPGEPGATAQVSCVATAPGFGSGTAVVTLSNGDDPWGPTVEFRVYNPNQTAERTNYYVLPGVNQTVTFTGLEPDGDHTIRVETKNTYAGFPKTLAVNVNCDSPVPAVQLTPSCTGAEGAVLVTMTNTGAEAVTFYVTNPKDLVVHTVLVAAGGTETLTFTGFGNGTYTVPVMAGQVDLSAEFTVTCAVPGEGSLSFTQACAASDGTLDIRLVVEGGTVPTEFVVEGTTYTVQPDSYLVVHLSGLADGVQTIDVMAGTVDLSFKVTIDCDRPVPSVRLTPSCTDAAGTLLVTMTNTGTRAVVFDVTNPKDLVVYHVLVAAGGTETLTFTGLINGTYTLPVMAGQVDLSAQFTVNCAVPGDGSVSFTQACVGNDGTLDIRLVAEGGNAPTEFVVQGITYMVEPDSELVVQLAGLADGVQTIAVTAGTTDFSFQTTVACDGGTESGSELPDTGGGGLPTWPAMLAIGSGSLLLLARRTGRRTLS